MSPQKPPSWRIAKCRRKPGRVCLWKHNFHIITTRMLGKLCSKHAVLPPTAFTALIQMRMKFPLCPHTLTHTYMEKVLPTSAGYTSKPSKQAKILKIIFFCLTYNGHFDFISNMLHFKKLDQVRSMHMYLLLPILPNKTTRNC